MKLIPTLKQLALVASAVACVAAPHAAQAGTADDAFNAWNKAFLKEQNGRTFYSKYLSKAESSGTWAFALDIAVAQDVYERTHSPQTRELVTKLVDSFLAENSWDWKGDSWNDDIAWMVIAVLRGYQITGNPKYLSQATYGWNMAYNRGWDNVGGGGIWEEMNSKFSKCGLSNNPMVTAAVTLYQITGDNAYLTKAESIYAWSRKYLFRASGQVDECMAFPKDKPAELQASDNAYNSGSFTEAANNLYRVTGKTQYRDDAQLAINHYIGKGAILSNNGERDTQWAYRLILGITEFCTNTNTCKQYSAWLQGNADAAWRSRNSLNITGNNWTKTFAVADPDAMQTSSAVAIWQLLPDTSTTSAFKGNYQLRNANSGLALSVEGGSTAAAAQIVQNGTNGGAEALWTFEAIGNGYYHVKNQKSGQLLNVAGASGKLGAALWQWPGQGLQPGNDQWKAVRNGDGTYSFYNRNSRLALDIQGASKAAGAKVQQWAPNDTAAQKFNLVQQGATGLVGVGSQRCLDVPKGEDGSTAQIGDCNGSANQHWVRHDNGTLEVHGKCLDVFGGGLGNGAKVGLWGCHGGSNQQWRVNADGSIVGVQSGLCLDVQGGAVDNNSPVILWGCNGGTNQKWTLH